MTKLLMLLLPTPFILLLGTIGGAVDRGFVTRTIEIESQIYQYQVFVPEQWTPTRRWPVVLFLHGAGERGSDGVKQTEVGLGPAIRLNPASLPALVVMPQCRRGVWWNDPAMESLALSTLEETIREYNGDPSRIYLTGLSMGGYGTFYLGAKYPDRFAALAPICGGVVPPNRLRQAGGTDHSEAYAEAARRIGNTPTWIFHGASDPVVPVSESQQMVKALEEQGISVKYTEYPGVGHNSWDAAYSESGFFTWLLSQRR